MKSRPITLFLSDMRILSNARIHTLDRRRPTASCLALEDGRLLAVGGDGLAEQFPTARKQDMGGAVILPGLTDAHLHLKTYALSLQLVDCEAPAKAACLERV
ncbi:MAG: hypothetical protein FJZ96_10090, partial [Chloroflexi bacterium]|nr:hypothetical protein [Chloroflexota bacterium]